MNSCKSSEQSGLSRIFLSLSNRNYRWYWLFQLAGFAAMMMGIVARSWLVWTLTGSELAIGMVNFAFGVPPLLFAIVGGAIVDRVSKRNLLITTQICQTVVYLVIAVLIITNAIELWHLIAAAACAGMLFVFEGPARQAIIPELVDRSAIMNAVSLNAAGINMMRVIGPAAAGILLVPLGTGGVYFIAAGLYFAAMFGLLMITPPHKQRMPVAAPRPAGIPGAVTAIRSVWHDLVEGLRYIVHSPVVLSLLIMAIIPTAFGLPYQNLLPVFADLILDTGEVGYGILMAVQGVGALVVSLGIASLRNLRGKGKVLIFLLLSFGVTLILFSLTRSFVSAVIFLILVGGSGAGYMALNNTALQTIVPMPMMGRVMSVYMLTFSFTPLGTLPIGALAEMAGTPLAIGAGGALIIIFTIIMAIARPSFRTLD